MRRLAARTNSSTFDFRVTQHTARSAEHSTHPTHSEITREYLRERTRESVNSFDAPKSLFEFGAFVICVLKLCKKDARSGPLGGDLFKTGVLLRHRHFLPLIDALI